MDRARSVVPALIGCLLVAFGRQAAVAEPLDYYMPTGVDYDQAIPRPADVLGHQLGAQPARHDPMVTYLRAVAAASDRITAETIGDSHQGRPILFFVVTSPANHARLETLRRAHVARTDPTAPDPTVPGPDDADMPVVTWVNYGVHGAEPSAMDAAIPTLYHLAAAQGPQIERTLDESIILITAIFNPDGHSRRINWVLQHGSTVTVTDPAHRIHNEAWPGGRTNHYWFDLNRQWLLLTQPESVAWVAKWHHWKPNVSGDMHDMGSNATYYFHPGVPARRNPLIPERSRDLLGQIAGYHAAFMDSEARLYYTEETFDNYYLGKGSTYPHVNGSIGILFEAGSARGGAIDTINGQRTFADNIRTHFRTSLTTIEGARALRGELLAHQRAFFRDGLEQARADATRAYVFAAPGDPARLFHFLQLLRRHDIDVYRLAGDVSADGRTFRAGQAYIVPLAQAQYRLIRGLFDRVREFEEKIFYDVSGWTMPLAYGLDYDGLSGRRFQSRLLGEPATPAMPTAPRPDRAPHSYVFDWTGYYAPRALYRLLGEDVLARVALKPFQVATTAGNVAMQRGAIVVPLARQDKDGDAIHAIVSRIAAEDGIVVHAATSGLTPTPGVDLGGRDSFRSVTAPKALMVVGRGVLAYDAGEIWHLLDHRMEIPLVMRDKARLSSVDWDDYAHVILPGGRNFSLPEKAEQRLQRWVRDGGTVIALRQGAEWAHDHLMADDDDKGSKDKKARKKKNGDDEDSEAPERIDYADFNRREAADVIGGAIYAGDLDNTHPLGFGYPSRQVASHRNTTIVFDTPDNPYATVVRYTDQPLMSGYSSDKRVEEIAGTPMMIAERRGRGSVILFTDNPNFRGTFFGTNKLFLNGLFFSRAFSAPRDDGRAADQDHQHQAL